MAFTSDSDGIAALVADSSARPGLVVRTCLRIGARKVIDEWQAEHGAFAPEELAAARAEMAAADVELFTVRQAA